MNKKTKNPILDMLLRKKAEQAKQTQSNKFRGNEGPKGKVNTKGFGGPSVTKKTGRGT